MSESVEEIYRDLQLRGMHHAIMGQANEFFEDLARWRVRWIPRPQEEGGNGGRWRVVNSRLEFLGEISPVRNVEDGYS